MSNFKIYIKSMLQKAVYLLTILLLSFSCMDGKEEKLEAENETKLVFDQLKAEYGFKKIELILISSEEHPETLEVNCIDPPNFPKDREAIQNLQQLIAKRVFSTLDSAIKGKFEELLIALTTTEVDKPFTESRSYLMGFATNGDSLRQVDGVPRY